MSGDIRKALDILRRAIDIAITEEHGKLLMKDVSLKYCFLKFPFILRLTPHAKRPKILIECVWYAL